MLNQMRLGLSVTPRRRRLTLLLLLIVCRAAAAVPPEAIAAADAWVERAIALGLPDARNGRLMTGTLRVTVRIPDDEHRPLWDWWWPLEIDAVRDGAGRHMYLHLGDQHLRLADGSWLAGCERHVRSQDGVEIDATELQPVTMAGAMERLPRWQVAPIARCINLRDAVELHVWRLGAPGREERALRNYIAAPWQSLLQSRSLVTGEDVATRWGGFVQDEDLSRRPADLLPRLLRDRAFIWFADRACDGIDIARDKAAAAALEFAPPALREDLIRYFASVAAAAAVPEWQTGGSLDDLLQGWNEGELPDSKLLDLDALSLALTDQRPSRWIESNQPRLVGDNALRAMAYRLGRDPRLLAGLDAGEPWTEAARTRTMPAVQTWWRENRTTPVAQLLAPTIAISSLQAQLQMVYRLQEQERMPVLEAIAAAWIAHDPFVDPPVKKPAGFSFSEPSAETLARGHRQTLDHMLALAGHQRILLDALDRLPDRPAIRLPRALAHDLRGEPRVLDELLETILAGGGDEFEGREVLVAMSSRPSPARLAILRATVSAKAARWPLVIGTLVLESQQNAPLQTHQAGADLRVGLALRLGLALTALEDRTAVDDRVKPAGPVYSHWRCGSDVLSRDVSFTGGLPGADRASPLAAQGGLRLCDIVAYALYEPARFAQELQPAGCDTSALSAARDATIEELRPRIAAAFAAEWKRVVGEGL